MPPYLEFEGFKFHGTPDECAAWAAKLQALKAGARQERVPDSRADAPPAIKGTTKPLPFPQGTLPRIGIKASEPVDEYAIKFIKAIRDASPPEGVAGETLMQVLDVTHPKGVGSKAASINRAIIRLGYKIEDVYTKTRGSDHVRRWHPGPKAWEAIKAFEDLVKGEA